MSLHAIVVAFFVGIFSLFYDTRSTQPVSASALEKKACKAIVFDLGGVVVDTCKKKMIWEIGPAILFDYWRHTKSSQELLDMQKRLYEFINAAHPSIHEGNQWGVKDGHGRELPQLFAEWLRGMKPNKELFDCVTEFANNNPDWFCHPSEKRMLIQASRTIFHPSSFLKTRKFFDEAVALIKECKERGFICYVVSNWDRESGKLMAKRNPEIFGLFDGIILSGNEQRVKPEPEIFSPITDVIPAEKCVFLDDQRENIEIAEQLGFNTILVEHNNGIPNLKAVREKLKLIQPEESIIDE